MSDYLTSTSQNVVVRPQRSIGGLIFDVTIEESHTDELEISDHPVEQGAQITDHSFKKPSGLTIKAGQSNSSGEQAGDLRTVEAYNALLKLQSDREPFDVITGKRAYKNMLVKSLSVTTDRVTENVLMFTAELREILIANVRVVSVPRSRQRFANKTGGVDKKGVAQAKQVNKSALVELLG